MSADKLSDSTLGSQAGSGSSSAGAHRRDVPQAHWRATLDAFSKRHNDCQVNVEVRSGGQTRREVKDRLLRGVSSDRNGGNDHVYVMTAGERARMDDFSHMIEHPSRVVLEGEETLEIEATDGSCTIVHCVRHVGEQAA